MLSPYGKGTGEMCCHGILGRALLYFFCLHHAKDVTAKPSCALTAAVVAPMGV